MYCCWGAKLPLGGARKRASCGHRGGGAHARGGKSGSRHMQQCHAATAATTATAASLCAQFARAVARSRLRRPPLRTLVVLFTDTSFRPTTLWFMLNECVVEEGATSEAPSTCGGGGTGAGQEQRFRAKWWAWYGSVRCLPKGLRRREDACRRRAPADSSRTLLLMHPYFSTH